MKGTKCAVFYSEQDLKEKLQARELQFGEGDQESYQNSDTKSGESILMAKVSLGME